MITPPLLDAGRPPEAGARTWRAGTLTYTAGGLAILFCWLLWGDFAWSMKERSVPSVVSLLLKKFHASDTLAGVLIGSLPAALGMIVSPIVSYKSDRHRSSWGRRIPFLFVPTPFAVLGMVSLAFSSQIGAALHRLLGPHSPGVTGCILISVSLSWTLFEVSTLVANSVYGGLINDVVPKEMLGRFFGAFRGLSLIAAIIFNFWMIGTAEAHATGIFLGMAALYGMGFSLMCLKVREGSYPVVLPMDKGRDTRGFLQAARTYFQESFGQSYYRLYFIAMAVSWQASMPISLFSIFYAKDVHLSLGAFGKCMALTYGISLALSYPLGMVVDRFHPLRVSMAVLALYALATLLGGLFIHDAWTFGFAWIVQGVLAGAWFTSVASIGQRLLPRAEFAQFFSAAGIVQSVAAIFVGAAVGAFLDHLHHFYRATFFIGSGLASVALVLCLILHGRFMELGGPRNYVAPERAPRRRDPSSAL